MSVTHSSAASIAAAPPAAPAKAEAEPAKEAEAPAKAAPAIEIPDEPLPNVAFTPEGELRTNSEAKLNAAAKSLKGLSTPAAVAASLTRSLGKPTWIEDEKTRVWIAQEPTKCVRLVMQEDGSVDLESMRFTESKTLSRSARQNLCTGKIEHDE